MIPFAVFLSTDHIPSCFVVYFIYLIYTLGEQILSLEVSPYLLPLFFGLKFICLIIIAEISPGNWVEDDLK